MKRSLSRWLLALSGAVALGFLPAQHALAQTTKKAQDRKSVV